MAIVALDAEDRVALVRQWRLPADAALLEIPAGGLDVAADGSKEDPEIASRRELEEETGLRARTWRKLGEFYTAPGFTDELMHLYLATDLEPAAEDGRLGPDEDERLILEWRPWQDAVAAVERGEIRDAKSIVGLFWLERLRRGQDTTGTAAPVAAAATAAGAAGAASAPTVGESVTVTYRMTMGEMLRASVGLARRSILVRVFGLLMVAVAIVPVMNGDVISLVFLVLGLAIATGWFTAPFAWWMFRKRPDLVGADTTLTVDDEGIGSGSDFGRGRTAWSTFRKVHDVADCFLFDTAAGVSMIVPKRAFTDAQLAVVYRLLDRNGLLPAAVGASAFPGQAEAFDSGVFGSGPSPPAWPSGSRVGIPGGRPGADGSRARASRYSREPGLSATARRRWVPASSRRPSRLRLCPRAKWA